MKRTISFSMAMTCLFSANVCHGHIQKKDSIMPPLMRENLFVTHSESHSINFNKPAAPPKKKSPRIKITGNISGKTIRHPRNIIASTTPITINSFLLKVLISFHGFNGFFYGADHLFRKGCHQHPPDARLHVAVHISVVYRRVVALPPACACLLQVEKADVDRIRD